MKRILAGAAFIMTVSSAGNALAAPGISTHAVNLRAGPGTNFPIVSTIPGHAKLQVEGCLEDWSWCNVLWRSHYGWASGNFIRGTMHGGEERMNMMAPADRVPIVKFDVNEYWDTYYRDEPFYGTRIEYGYHEGALAPATNRPPLDRATGVEGASSVRNRILHMRDDRLYQK